MAALPTFFVREAAPACLPVGGCDIWNISLYPSRHFHLRLRFLATAFDFLRKLLLQKLPQNEQGKTKQNSFSTYRRGFHPKTKLSFGAHFKL